MAVTPTIRLEPWSEADLDLERRVSTPEMNRYLGGMETDEQIVARHRRFLQTAESGKGQMFRVVLLPAPEPAGSVGYWERVWRDENVYEMGWKILPEYQGRGIATAAIRAAAEHARARRRHRYAHAFPSVENGPSNAICRKAGFVLLGEHDFEYPKGSFMRCNDWRLDLDLAGG
jgi:RimJ/RimL family protein N-acetyltransferase